MLRPRKAHDSQTYRCLSRRYFCVVYMARVNGNLVNAMPLYLIDCNRPNRNLRQALDVDMIRIDSVSVIITQSCWIENRCNGKSLMMLRSMIDPVITAARHATRECEHAVQSEVLFVAYFRHQGMCLGDITGFLFPQRESDVEANVAMSLHQ